MYEQYNNDVFCIDQAFVIIIWVFSDMMYMYICAKFLLVSEWKSVIILTFLSFWNKFHIFMLKQL